MTAEARRDHQDVQGRSTAVAMPHARGIEREPARERPNAFVKRYRIEIAASSSSVFSTLVAFPLDSVKTRMQTYQYQGFLDCVKRTYRTEALGGFFRGKTRPIYIGHLVGPSLGNYDVLPRCFKALVIFVVFIVRY